MWTEVGCKCKDRRGIEILHGHESAMHWLHAALYIIMSTPCFECPWPITKFNLQRVCEPSVIFGHLIIQYHQYILHTHAPLTLYHMNAHYFLFSCKWRPAYYTPNLGSSALISGTIVTRTKRMNTRQAKSLK